MTYKEKLLDPRWQKKRLGILNRDGWRCQECSDDKKTLHIHHLHYESNKEPWDCPDYCLITLCADCHTETENAKKDYEATLLRSLRIGLKNSFLKHCASQVLSRYDIESLFYLLWEVDKEKVMSFLENEVKLDPLTIEKILSDGQQIS